MFSFEQISRLTWFTRFDPVEPKEQVFSVERRTKSLEVITSQTNEMGVTGREQESSNGKTSHHRKGGSLSCVAITLFHLSVNEHALSTIQSLLSPSWTLQTLYPPCPASRAIPGWCLPSTGCVGWREGRREMINLWRLQHLHRPSVLWRKSHVYDSLSTSTSLFAYQ